MYLIVMVAYFRLEEACPQAPQEHPEYEYEGKELIVNCKKCYQRRRLFCKYIIVLP